MGQFLFFAIFVQSVENLSLEIFLFEQKLEQKTENAVSKETLLKFQKHYRDEKKQMVRFLFRLRLAPLTRIQKPFCIRPKKSATPPTFSKGKDKT